MSVTSFRWRVRCGLIEHHAVLTLDRADCRVIRVEMEVETLLEIAKINGIAVRDARLKFRPWIEHWKSAEKKPIEIDFHDESVDFLHSIAHNSLFASDSEKNSICASHLTSSTSLECFPLAQCTALAIKSRKIAETFSIAPSTCGNYRNEILHIFWIGILSLDVKL